MSDQWDFEDDDNSGQQQQGKGLRAQLEAALKQNKELQAKLADAEKGLRREAVARVVNSKGLKAKVAKLIPSDVEPTDEGITKWLDEFGDVFGVDNMKETPPEGQQQAAAQSADDEANIEYAQQVAAMGRATGAATPPVKQEDILKRIQDPAMDKKALLELISAQGGGYGAG